jgi:transcriptional regulator GlxA family with amidase domain
VTLWDRSPIERAPIPLDIHAMDETMTGCAGKGRVRHLVRLILADPSGDCSVERLAGRAALSPRAMSRLFVQETGITPAKFVERARVRLACELMEETDLRMAAIAARSGFGSDERMRRAFHRVLGMSPREKGASQWAIGAHRFRHASVGLRHDA